MLSENTFYKVEMVYTPTDRSADRERATGDLATAETDIYNIAIAAVEAADTVDNPMFGNREVLLRLLENDDVEDQLLEYATRSGLAWRDGFEFSFDGKRGEYHITLTRD